MLPKYLDTDNVSLIVPAIDQHGVERRQHIEEVLSRYQTTLKPMHDQFIEPTKEYADLIIPNNRYNTVAVDMIRNIINQRLVNN